MEEVVVAEHAFKHGMGVEDIEYAWEHFVRRQCRGAPNEGQVAVVGYDREGRLVQLVAYRTETCVVIFHAMAPPTKKLMAEVGLVGRHRCE